MHFRQHLHRFSKMRWCGRCMPDNDGTRAVLAPRLELSVETHQLFQLASSKPLTSVKGNLLRLPGHGNGEDGSGLESVNSSGGK